MRNTKPVCTDRHGFELNIGDKIEDYSTPGLQIVIEEIDVLGDVMYTGVECYGREVTLDNLTNYIENGTIYFNFGPTLI